MVSIIQDEENLIEARLAAKGSENSHIVILALNETLARIMVHTSRQRAKPFILTEAKLFSLMTSR